MNQLWLITMVALLVINVIAQDEGEEHFLNLVRKKACAGRSCSDTNVWQTETDLTEEEGKMDDSSHGEGDDEQDVTSFMQAPAVKLRQSSTGGEKCKTLRCRLRYALESDKDVDQEWGVNTDKDDRSADKPKKRCVAWNCKRENVLPKKSQVTDNKRCMSWGCRKRSLKAAFKRDSTTTRNNDERKEDNLQRQERSDVEKNVQSKRCMTRECKKEEELLTRNIKRKASTKCLAWYCQGKRTVAVKRSGKIDTSKRIISRKPEEDLALFDLSRDGKCKGLECLTKRMRESSNSDVASLSKKNKMLPGCITWDCYGKRTAAKKEPAAIDSFKRIISRKNDKDLKFLGLSDEKCRGWDCLKKRVVHGIQNDIPTKCLSWDCDKRRADTGESTKSQGDRSEQLHESDTTHYGIPDEYKDMIRMPIRRDVLGRVSPYFTDRGSRRTLQKDIQEK